MNIKSIQGYLLSTAIVLFLISCANSKKINSDNDWIKLFNGHDLEDWIVKVHHHEVGVNFGNTFRAEDGMIKVRYDQYDSFNDQAILS